MRCWLLLLRLVPLTFLLYQFSLLLFAAWFAVVFVVDSGCQKRNLIGTDRIVEMASFDSIGLTNCVAGKRLRQQHPQQQPQQQPRQQQQQQPRQQLQRQHQQHHHTHENLRCRLFLKVSSKKILSYSK
ncbi:unnamed protein product [Polarella glacialis]|uniref:Uncharacterized protein n=1 Tax=Polarella glacialis TaxID=89957 RepID=A0A813KGE2_POLGL|nr:unnamed protein product [Polarella glacialis]